ncbi:hypothetical protein MPTK1_3g07550 [Marchantia polymorpha subsp. ruderalis]|uniref:Uncharacterized protein n=2 Tax=Marchantia polymorpha TaxID=3197 RepID=A0AAF6AYE5_MARPO|nr:hypothetical protein MARPO_0006s0230 [Marchantia polymorpha]BBN04779.1 hypothetical protein Mp_3g07550 [Marchantia polymorpha subsp. ruderalis]|eukprot:PTQ48225.1 hypothetical protein MARPO_0006s0230 [Marchantia polymorpha]
MRVQDRTSPRTVTRCMRRLLQQPERKKCGLDTLVRGSDRPDCEAIELKRKADDDGGQEPYCHIYHGNNGFRRTQHSRLLAYLCCSECSLEPSRAELSCAAMKLMDNSYIECRHVPSRVHRVSEWPDNRSPLTCPSRHPACHAGTLHLPPDRPPRTVITLEGPRCRAESLKTEVLRWVALTP